MTQSDRDREIEQLNRFRALALELEGDVWGVEVEDGRARLVSTRSTGEIVTLALFGEDVKPAELELLAGALGLNGFFLMMQHRAAAKVRALMGEARRKGEEDAPGPYASSAADLCQDVRFRQFLETKGPRTSVPDPRRAEMRLRMLIGLANLRQLDTDAALLALFRALLSDFDTWKRKAA